MARAIDLQAATLPAVLAAPAARSILINAATPSTLDLSTVFTVPGVTGTIAHYKTDTGAFAVELLPSAAPNHVANFTAYVTAKSYDNTLFHRVASFELNITHSILQGGGYKNVDGLPQLARLPAVALEYNLPNARGTLAAARTDELNSATSEWFFNTRDNSTILGQANNGGYSVFGRVLGTGMTVVDTIASLPLINLGIGQVTPIHGGSTIFEQLVTVETIRIIPLIPTSATSGGYLTFTATSSQPAVATVAIVDGRTLAITRVSLGATTITLVATDINGNQAQTSFVVNVTKVPQAITFATPANRVIGSAPFALSASSTSALPVSFSVVSGPASLAGSTLTMNGVGVVTLRATQSGNATYAAATLDRTFTVLPPTPASLGSSITRKAGSSLSLSTTPANPPAGLAYYATGLPAGLTLNATTGALTGTLNAPAGVYTVKYWTQLGTIKSSTRTLTWTVEPFPAVLTGKFEGLFVAPTTGFPVAKLEITVTNTGAFTGRLTHGTPGNSAVSGQLVLDSTETFATRSSASSGGFSIRSIKVGSGLTATLRQGTSTTTIGTLTDGVKLAAYTGVAPSAPAWAGAYTATFSVASNLDPATTDRPAPVGAGYATGSVNATGLLALTGKLANGTSFTGSFASDTAAGYRVFVQPHGTAGNYLGGWLKLTLWATSPSKRYRVAAADGQDFFWNKPAKVGDTSYLAGFGPLALQVKMATWLPPTATRSLATQLGLTSTTAAALKLAASGAGLTSTQATTLASTVALKTDNTLFIADTTKAKLWTSLSLTPASGLLTGSIKVQDTSTTFRLATWSGVVLQLPPAERAKVLAEGSFMLPPKTGLASGALGGSVKLTTP